MSMLTDEEIQKIILATTYGHGAAGASQAQLQKVLDWACDARMCWKMF